MNADHGPIGVFDSGIGGVSVLKAIASLVPAEPLLYLADAAHAPYGGLPEAEIRDRALACAEFLVAEGARAVVVACNTATAAAVDVLRTALAIPVIAMEPGIKPAAAATRSGMIGVLATAATARSYRLGSLIERYAASHQVLVQPCPGLVDLIEAGATDGPELTARLEELVMPLVDNGVDTLILGCTHYPLISPLITRVAGPDVHVVDTGEAVARRLRTVLAEGGLLTAGHSPAPSPRFCTTGNADHFRSLLMVHWGTVAEVETVCATHSIMKSGAGPS